MRFRLTVLWEDHPGPGGPKDIQFGPHALALECAADVLKVGGRFVLRDSTSCIPVKGDGNLVRRLENDVQPLLESTERLIFVFDDDGVRRQVGLPDDACRTVTLGALRARARVESAPRVQFVLLDRNVETLVMRCCELLGRAAPSKKPRPVERDRHLMAMADADAEKRAELVETVSSFGRLVRAFVQALS